MKQYKKILLCPDSFKGSLSARRAAEALARGVLRASPNVEAEILPIADGGEGTLDALTSKQARIRKTVRDPMGRPIKAEYGFVGNTAIIEMAAAAGLCLLDEQERSAADSSTYGVGELIQDALTRGYQRLMITVGGSATNDGGSGMLEALGAAFYRADGTEITGLCGRKLGQIARIDTAGLDPRLLQAELLIACDVTNPLLGKTGATYIYGPQKGADANTLALLERGMESYAARLAEVGKEIASIPGAGAGGGLPAPLLSLCRAQLRSGIDAVLSALDFEHRLKDADLVITGEGRIDRQSAYGKAISGVARRASAKGIPVFALVGACGEGAEELRSIGLTRICAICDLARDAKDSMTRAEELLEELAFAQLQTFGKR